MRNGPPNRKVFHWFRRSWDQRKTRFYQLVFGAAVLILFFAALPLQAQIPALLAPQATREPTQQGAVPTPNPSPTPIQAIALPQIADKAEEMDGLLREISKNLYLFRNYGLQILKGKHTLKRSTGGRARRKISSPACPT